MEQKIFIPFPRLCCCRWERRLRGHPAPGPGRPRETRGPPARAQRRAGRFGELPAPPCPRVWGRAEGPTGRSGSQNLKGREEARGEVLLLTPGPGQRHGWRGEGRAWSRGRGGQGPALPHGCPAPPGSARHGRGGNAPRGRTSRPPPLDTLSREGGAGGRWWCRGAFRAKQWKRNYPPPSIHLLKSGDICLTKHSIIQAFVQNILIKILSDIDTHTNDRTLLS